MDSRLGPRLVPRSAPPRARRGAPRRRLVGVDDRGRDRVRGAPRARRAGAGDTPRLRPFVPLEVPRRQLDATARGARAVPLEAGRDPAAFLEMIGPQGRGADRGYATLFGPPGSRGSRR